MLSHADWRLDNLFFTDDDDVIAIDWQLIDRSVGPRDLSYHVTQSVNIDDPAGYRHAFDTYVSDLAELGVDVDRDVGVGDVPLRHDARVRVSGHRDRRAHDRTIRATSS